MRRFKRSEAPFPKLNPRWKDVSSSSEMLKSVKTKEKAVQASIKCLDHMMSVFEAQGTESAARLSQHWRNRIKDHLEQQHLNNIQVNLRGATGKGKSTLINALLNIDELLPTSMNRACTAVAVEVRYNYSDDESESFKAEVEFMTRREWRADLKVLLREAKQHLSELDETDVEIDLDRKRRLKEAVDRLKFIYPNIGTLEQLAKAKLRELINHPGVQDVLGGTKTIRKRRLRGFSAAIRKYIDGGIEGDDRVEGFAHWPLIKLVRVYVKSEILANGITLVDLPGSYDSNSARCAVAEKYQQKGTINCIVEGMKRGITSQQAHNLLAEYTKLNMVLDGTFNSDQLCFVLTHCDETFALKKYARQEPKLKQELGPYITDMNQKGAMFKERTRQRDDVKALCSSLKSEIEMNMEGFNGRLKRKYEDSDSDESPSTTQKLPGQQTLPQLQKLMKEYIKSEESLSKRIDSLQIALNKSCSRAIIRATEYRNAQSTKMVRNDYEQTLQEIHKETDGTTLQVFCVASKTYLEYLRPDITARKMAFPTKADTQIPSLRDWLIKFTWKQRDQNAQVFLESVENLLSSMKPWLRYCSKDAKLTVEQRANMQRILHIPLEGFEEAFQELALATEKSVKKMIRARIYDLMPEAERTAALASRDTIREFTVNMKWNTHMAVNFRFGEWLRSRTDEMGDINWNQRLASDYKKAFIEVWNDTFTAVIEQEMADFVSNSKILVAERAAAVLLARQSFPRLSIYLDMLADNLSNTYTLLEAETTRIAKQIRNEAQDAHALVSAQIKAYLSPMYEKCSERTGKGVYNRNKLEHKLFIRKNGLAMYKSVSMKIMAHMDMVLSDVRFEFAVSYRRVITAFEAEIDMFLNNHSTAGSHASDRQVTDPIKAKMREAIDPALRKLEISWATEVVFEVEERDKLEDMKFLEDDAYGLKFDPDDDEYDPVDSEDDG